MNDIQKEISVLWQKALDPKMVENYRKPGIVDLINTFENDTIKEGLENYEPWLSILNEGIFLLSHLYMMLDKSLSNDFEKDKEILIPNMLIGTACAHTVAIRRLVLSGLDCSAKIILRTLLETLNILIVVINDPTIASNYHAAQEFEHAKIFWLKNFSTKKMLQLLSNIEVELGFDKNVIQELIQWREEESSFLSQYVHSSYISACFSSQPPSAKEPYDHVPGMPGAASILSRKTLAIACRSIWYFSCIGIKLLIGKDKANDTPIYKAFHGEDGKIVILARELYNDILLKYWDKD